jgi:hypothetical protein
VRVSVLRLASLSMVLHSLGVRVPAVRVSTRVRVGGLSTEQFPVSAYVGSSKNLRDLKEKGWCEARTTRLGPLDRLYLG